MSRDTEDVTPISTILQELAPQLEGELLRDRTHRLLYSTDASIFQEMPLAVARPKHHEDCVTLVRLARRHGIPLIGRGAGTSLAGQCVGSGLVVDFSRHMDRILEIDAQARTARVEPGVVLDDLNDAMRPHGLMFGAETSTSSRCTLGGMVGNNAAGSHSIVLGTTRDHIEELTCVLSDGSTAVFGPLDGEDLASRCLLESLEGRIYQTVTGLVEHNAELIRARFPKAEVVRRNTGYALDALLQRRPFTADGSPFSLAPLVCGSEGTLCLVTAMKVRLVPRPRHTILVCAHFRELEQALVATMPALEHRPSAVELLDGTILEAARTNLEQQRNRSWMQGQPAGVLAIEFSSDDREVLDERARELIDHFRQAGLGYAFSVLAGPDIERVWALRKAGLGLMTGRPGALKAVTVTEDAAVAPADLPAYVARMRALMERFGTRPVYYGHASVGLLHLRPMLNLGAEDGLERLDAIAREAARIIREFRGSLSGEHGDGRLRGPYIEEVFGPEVYRLLIEVKRAFDPTGVLNPHKVVDALPIEGQLRITRPGAVEGLSTLFDWSADLGFVQAVERCVGSGVCVRGPGRGMLCPSYQATREELHSTRGRANVLRQLLQGEDPAESLSGEEIEEALELCLSCKACKAECPSSVDMARLKAEVLQHRHDRLGIGLSDLVFGHFDELAALGRLAPRLASGLMNRGWFMRVLGVDVRRRLPALARESFGEWWGKRSSSDRGPRSAVDPSSRPGGPERTDTAADPHPGTAQRPADPHPGTARRPADPLDTPSHGANRAGLGVTQATDGSGQPMDRTTLPTSETIWGDPGRSGPILTAKNASNCDTIPTRKADRARHGVDAYAEVVLLVDAFTNHLEPEVGMAAVEVLEAVGMTVTVLMLPGSPRTRLSHGLVLEARQLLEQAVEALYPYAAEGLPVVGLEPSELLTFRDEAPDLVSGSVLKAKARVVAERSRLFEELLVELSRTGRLDRVCFHWEGPLQILFHGHCHQKSLASTSPTKVALELIPGAVVSEIPSGCCGMAGSFGYRHREVSMAIGEQVLFPAIRAAGPEVILVASGTSCRQQILDGTGRKAWHPGQVLRRALRDPPNGP